MKIFMMLIVLLSMFFVISCGGDDSSEGMSESEFYSQSNTQSCEKAFECEISYITSTYATATECSAGMPSSCTTEYMKFDGVKAQECYDCAATLSCNEFFDNIGQELLVNCPACKNTCVPK